jgi:ABC-type multidrug transport system ATPase subunit
LDGTPVLAVDGLTRLFGGLIGVRDVSFALEAGQACAVVGPNGSGKTTLLRCVVGADRPDAGSVRLDGRPVTETDPSFRSAVACVLDDMDFFPDLSVIEHLGLLAYAHGTPDVATVVEGLVGDLGLDPARDQLSPTLSSGQRRRLALASCFVRPRRLLVLDEPEQRLDVDGRQWLTERLLADLAAGTAVLFASHDPELVEALGDQVLELG